MLADVVELGQLTVTAARRNTLALDTPASLHVLSAEELRMRGQVRSTPEALQWVPGVLIQRTGHGQGSPYIRGFTGFRTLFLIDGVRLNNSVFRDGPNQYWNTVDPFSIGSLEIVKGPISVLYGSDAIGGTVNALTADPGALSDGPLRGSAQYRHSGGENSNLLRVDGATFLNDNLGLRVGATLKDFGDLRSAAGTQQRTGYAERDIDLKAVWDGPTAKWEALYQRVAIDDAWRTHRTIYAQSFAGTTIGNELRRSLNQRRELGYVRYRRPQAGLLQDLSLTVSGHHQAEDRLRIRSDGRSDHQGVATDTTGLVVEAAVEATPGRWQFGLEHYADEVDSFRTDFNADGSVRAIRIQGPVADDASYRHTGAFVQAQFDTGPVSWTAGARHTRSRARARRVEDPATGGLTALAGSWSDTVSSLRAVYRPAGARWSLFGGTAEGFRAPNLSDISRLDSARSDEIEVPSPGLRPETFLSHELGFRLEQPRLHLQLAAFYTDIDDLIIRTPTGRQLDGDNEVVKVNSGEGYSRGLEFEGRFEARPGLDLFASYTWLQGEVLTYPTSAPVAVTEPLDRLMPTTLGAGLRWKPGSGDGWLELALFHTRDADRLSTRDAGDTQRIPPGGTPGTTLVDVRGGWNLTPGIDVAIAIENLTDRLYRTHGSGVNEAGRNLVVSIRWQPGLR